MDRILLKLGAVSVYSWGFMVAVGILVATVFVLREAKKSNLDPDNILNVGLASIVSSLIGARIYYVIEHLSDFTSNWIETLYVWDGGLVFYGGLIGFGLAFFFTVRHYKLPLLKLMDIISPFLPLAYAFGRIGCFLNGCCYGIVANTPISVEFKDAGVPGERIPTELIDSLINFLLFVYLYTQRKSGRFQGDITTRYLMIYSVIRFLIEFLRDEARIFLKLTHSQIFSVLLFVFALSLRIYLKDKHTINEV